jgi:ABC-type spermidine/putrescine transport system permease subunit I
MSPAQIFECNEVLTLASGIVAAATYLWMKWRVPEYRTVHLNSLGPLLGIVEAYRNSGRPSTEKSAISATFRVALSVFLVCAVISFAAGFVAAVRGPSLGR